MTYPTTGTVERYGREFRDMPMAKVSLNGAHLADWLAYNMEEGWVDVEKHDPSIGFPDQQPRLRIAGVVTVERETTDQQHADAIRAAADKLDAAMRAAAGDGMNTHVHMISDAPIPCGFIRHIGVGYVEVIRAITVPS